MTWLDPAPGRRRERIVGAVVVLVGVAVLVLSVVALVSAGNGPGSDVSGPSVTLPGGSGSATPSGSTSASPSTTPSGSAPPSSGAPTGATPTGTTPTGSTTSGTATTSPGGGTRTQPLVVLNNTTETGLAQQAAATFRAGGWTVTGTGNLRDDVLSTCAYYDPDVDGAQAAAEALMQQFPAIKRIKEKYGALPAGPVVVVLTTDYTSQ